MNYATGAPLHGQVVARHKSVEHQASVVVPKPSGSWTTVEIPLRASAARPETPSPIILVSTIGNTVSWMLLPLPLNGPESAYRTRLQKLPRNPGKINWELDPP